MVQAENRAVVSTDYTRWGLAIASILGGCVVVIICASLPHYTGSTWAIIAAICGVMAVLSDIWCVQARRSASSTHLALYTLLSGMICTACAAFCASLYISSSHMAAMSALCVSCAVACECACMASILRDSRVWAVARTSSIIACITACACAVPILCDLPSALLAGTVLGVSVCAMQVMPNLVVHVPDRYLVEWRQYMKQRWTVRGGIPEESRILRKRDVEHEMEEFLASYATGIAWCLGLTLISYIGLIQWMDAESIYARIGMLTLTACLVLWLIMKPRTASRAFERYMMRGTGLIILAYALAHSTTLLRLPEHNSGVSMLIAVLCVVVACIMIASLLAQQGGFYSLVLSRIGDALCFLALSLIPVAAFFAAGTLEWLRSVQW